ncbi:MAG: hypothetical protein E7365_05665 [Clostridiales bacterium]|nr:hypothetical protein [Clostridiales bacterium]
MFFNELIAQTKLILQGNLNFGHYLTFALGLIALIVSIHNFKDRTIKGVFSVFATLFYTFGFCITFNNYATPTSALIFSITAIVLNFLIWLFVSRINIKTCFVWLQAYFLVLLIMVLCGLIRYFVKINFSDSFLVQISFLFVAAILSFSVPLIANSSSGNSSSDPFDGYGPGWKGVLSWR